MPIKKSYSISQIPLSRIATFDIFSVGLTRHHVAALLEFDVTTARQKIRKARRNGRKISFNSWLLRVIAVSVQEHPEVVSYLNGKSKLLVFDSINISVLIEKRIGDKLVPIPYVLIDAAQKSAEEISLEIEQARNAEIKEGETLIQRDLSLYEKLYYRLPGFLRRLVWRLMLKKPQFIFSKMGNISVTSLGTTARLNGWFVHRSVHPLSFGFGSVIKKPVVIDDKVAVREILNSTILLDHDVVDGAPMARFIDCLSEKIKNGAGIED